VRQGRVWWRRGVRRRRGRGRRGERRRGRGRRVWAGRRVRRGGRRGWRGRARCRRRWWVGQPGNAVVFRLAKVAELTIAPSAVVHVRRAPVGADLEGARVVVARQAALVVGQLGAGGAGVAAVLAAAGERAPGGVALAGVELHGDVAAAVQDCGWELTEFTRGGVNGLS
jgi:hypothetical protein